ncbi:MAG: ECF transporter S component [Oscillospiraceae bacterium]|nr:ECF transporter S component [Oscillospiraceae bacterium]
MRNDKIKKLVWAALFMALTTIATMIIQVPIGVGYGNAGDTLVILSAFILGSPWGALAAGLGSALADLLSGFVIYAPATLIIKALMALAAGAILRSAKKKNALSMAVLGSIAAEIIMIAGYFAYDAIVMGYGLGALANIPGNCIQGAINAVAGTSLFYALLRIPYVKKNF